MSFSRRHFLALTTAAAGVWGLGLGQQRLQGQVYPDQPSDRQPKTRSKTQIAVISDLNSQYGSTDYEPEVDQAVQLILKWQPDLVLCGGDMVAGQKQSLSDAQVQAMWAGFEAHIRKPLAQAQIPLGFTLGNHDGSGARSGGRYTFERDRHLAQAYWTDPAHDPGLAFLDRSHFPFYYTFAQDEIFYLVWDASTAQLDTEQLAWVEAQLQSPAARKARLRIVIGHLPLYPVAVNRDRPGEFLDEGDGLRSLLERYQVHTYISGHHHAYYPGHRGGLELLYTGAIGSGPRQLLGSDLAARKTLTVIEVDALAAPPQTLYTTYVLPSLEILAQAKLPRIIQSPHGWVLRRDLAETDLRSPEQPR